ncbi:SAM-dependent methyltransferase [Fischerella thermalis]|uniref:SAM-dependent methyltransferase n=1 Tax=Fischerella thermalis TaxID=372787 RepID=UPI000C801106|nr:SAM-dependent methyltransferase [Fischerella thermalis]PLZ28614.1 SAM-dependent methyltransferase [Fischerella thermalis WC341]PLZ62639.1 SAM-dependent methyltransferase [Fischerella thermalis WC344]
MVMKLEKVVPFGRSLDEYVQMFHLTKSDLRKRILGVGDGPASFNAEATKIGVQVTSIDPIYQFSGDEILKRFNEMVDNIIDQVKASPDDWTWSYHTSPENLRWNRVQAINKFISDYEQGKQEKRYQIGELPKLNFQDKEYDLALCSHFLFLYSDHHDYQFHFDAIKEMLRVSQEVRIFPLLTLMLQRSPYLDHITQELQELGYTVSIVKVKYELQKGGNEMLWIR